MILFTSNDDRSRLLRYFISYFMTRYEITITLVNVLSSTIHQGKQKKNVLVYTMSNDLQMRAYES
jgi:hypothetical protein